MLKVVWLLLLATSCWALPLKPALSQAVPDAGAVLRQAERERATPLPAAVPAPSAPTAAGAPADDASVQVRRFSFSGNRLMSDAQLAVVVAPYLDRPLRLADLQAATAAVAARYRADGWLARAVLPRQEITIHSTLDRKSVVE